eukprot:2579429-Prymnesium_polylepis.2
MYSERLATIKLMYSDTRDTRAFRCVRTANDWKRKLSAHKPQPRAPPASRHGECEAGCCASERRRAFPRITPTPPAAP